MTCRNVRESRDDGRFQHPGERPRRIGECSRPRVADDASPAGVAPGIVGQINGIHRSYRLLPRPAVAPGIGRPGGPDSRGCSPRSRPRRRIGDGPGPAWLAGAGRSVGGLGSVGPGGGESWVREGDWRQDAGGPGWNLCVHLRCEHGEFVADESGAGVPRRGGPVLTTGPLGGPQEERPIPPPVFAGRTGAGSHGSSGRLRSDRRDCGRGRWFPPGPLNPGSPAGVRGGIGGRP